VLYFSLFFLLSFASKAWLKGMQKFCFDCDKPRAVGQQIWNRLAPAKLSQCNANSWFRTQTEATKTNIKARPQEPSTCWPANRLTLAS